VRREAGWWIAVLFIVGSSCFALGAFPPYASAVGATADNVTYFIGSLFFTTAAFLQFRASTTRADWWAGIVQLGGTLLFNRSTFSALQHDLTAVEIDHHVWRPDALGSIAFLVALSAVASYVVPDSGELVNARWANLGTFAGAVCFLVGAVLILPKEQRPPSVSSPPARRGR
jgi:hypothetical protein